MATTETPRAAAHEVRAKAESGSGWYSWTARGGLVAKGISYGIVGVLALKLAAGDGGKATSRAGALHSLAELPVGEVLLVVLAAGFAAYALWRFIQAFAERGDGDDGKDEAKTWGKRAGYVGRGLVYAGLTYSTLRLVAGSGAESQNEKAHKTAALVFDWPAGRWLVGAAGVVIAGAGAWNLYRGLTKKFEDKWRVGGMSAVERRWGARAGVVGHIARGVVFGLIGWFMLKAAVEYDANDAIGLDGALQKLAEQTYGRGLLAATAIGLIAYGIFCLVDARYRDVSTSGSGPRRSDAPVRAAG